MDLGLWHQGLSVPFCCGHRREQLPEGGLNQPGHPTFPACKNAAFNPSAFSNGCNPFELPGYLENLWGCGGGKAGCNLDHFAKVDKTLVDASGRNGCICPKDWNALGMTLLPTNNEALLDSG